MAIELLKSRAAPRTAARFDDRDETGAGTGGNAGLALLIGEHVFAITHLAANGSVIVHFDGQAEPNQMLQAALLATFDGFEVSVPSLWEVIACVRETSQLTLRLAPVNEASHLAAVNTLLEAIGAGERLQPEDFVDIARTGASLRPAPELEASQSGWFKRRAGAIVFFLIALVLLAFIGTNLAVRAFYVSADGSIASPRAVMVQAPEESELVSLSALPGTRVPAGGTVATIKLVSGQLLKLTSTCDCIVGGQLVSVPTLLRRGQPLVRLVPAQGVDHAILRIPLEDLRRVRLGDRVKVSFYDSDQAIYGRIDQVNPPKLVGDTEAQPARFAGTISVKFATNIPAARVGEAVTASVLLSHLNPLA